MYKGQKDDAFASGSDSGSRDLAMAFISQPLPDIRDCFAQAILSPFLSICLCIHSTKSHAPYPVRWGCLQLT